MTEKKRYLIEVFLKSSKQQKLLEDSFIRNEMWLMSLFPSINPEEIKEKIKDFNVEKCIEEIYDIIDKYFTEEDLQKIVDFYCSVSGKKLVLEDFMKDTNNCVNKKFAERYNEIMRDESNKTA